jgi:hypothetical protein
MLQLLELRKPGPCSLLPARFDLRSSRLFTLVAPRELPCGVRLPKSPFGLDYGSS